MLGSRVGGRVWLAYRLINGVHGLMNRVGGGVSLNLARSNSNACVIIKLAVFRDISGDDAGALLAWLSTTLSAVLLQIMNIKVRIFTSLPSLKFLAFCM